MQNKGFVKFLAVALTLVCLFYLSFSIVTQTVDRKADEMYALKTKADSLKADAYLDSLNTTPFFLGSYNLKQCRETSIGLGLDLAGGMNVMLEVSVADVLKALSDGKIEDKKTINVPGVNLNLKFMSEVDKKDIAFAAKHACDYLALSFVNSKEDVVDARKIIEDAGGDALIISKIESHMGIENIDEIIDESDGIMVARGDLGVNVPLEKLPILQKEIITKCRQKGKFAIVATEMLESMKKSARPTRAEVSDVANAILDGTDAIMLSGESANGDWPVESVQTMAKIATETEKKLNYETAVSKAKSHVPATSGVISRAACNAANELKAAAIVSSTKSGATARRISQCRPECPIVAVTPCEKVAKSLAFCFGVYPVVAEDQNSTDAMMANATKIAVENNFANTGDTVVIAAGLDQVGSTNLLKVSVVE